MAQKLKFGNGTWATKEGSTLAYNDENENYKPLPFNFERDSIATRVNKEGLIEVVGKDIPRIDYTDNKEGVLLLEPSRTNLIPYSEDFSNSGWTKNNTTVTSGFTSPDSTNNAYKMTDDATDSKHGVYDLDVLSQDGNVYTRSVFVKKGTARYVVLSARHLPTSSGTSWIYDFDINDWVLTGSTGVGQSIEDYGNGWIRLSISHISNSNFNNDFSIGISSGATISDATYSGSGDTLYIYGAQAEQGSYPTSYIPTSGSTVQRAAETANGSGNSEVFNDSEGSLYMDFDVIEKTSSSYYVVSIRSSNGSDVLGVGSRQGKAFAEMFDGTNYISNNSANIVDGKNKIFLTYNSGSSAKLFLNGIKVLDFTGTIPTLSNLSELTQGDRFLNNKYYGNISEIGYYDEILTDEELEYMTSYRTWVSMVNELNLNIIYNG